MVATIILDGLAYGMVLFLITVGLTVTMGLMRVINLAHGAFAMIGGYTASALHQRGVPFWVTLPAAVLFVTALGALAERLVYRPLYDKGELAQVLMTFGLTFIVIATLTLLFGPGGQPAPVPQAFTGSVDLGFRTYPVYRLAMIGCGLGVALALWLILDRSLFGARLRAGVDNPRMAGVVGMNVNRLFAFTFAGGCGLAALGGVLGAGMLPLVPFYAVQYLPQFMLIVAIGGLGSLRGSFVAATGYGLIDTTGKYLAPDFAAYVPYLAVLALLLWRPHGILARRAA